MKNISLFLLSWCVNLSASAQTKIIVAQDGSGNYKTVQAIPINNKKPITILIKNGIYKENFILIHQRIL